MGGCRLLPIASGAFLLTLFAGCSNHEFRPDQSVESLVADLEKAEESILMKVSWFPLIALNAKAFTYVDETEEYLPGHSHSEIDAWGPIFLVASLHERWYDESNELYEIQEYLDVISSLWTTEKSLSRTPTGWREEVRREIILGLFRIWTEVRYLDELPDEYRTKTEEQDVTRDGDLTPSTT